MVSIFNKVNAVVFNSDHRPFNSYNNLNIQLYWYLFFDR